MGSLLNLTRAAGSAERASVIGLASGKGGVGRSMIAVELGRALVRHGKTVLLVDLEIRSRSLAALVELTVFNEPDFYAPLVERIEKTGNSSLDVLQLDGFELTAESEDHGDVAHDLTDFLRTLDYDWVILDLPGGFELDVVSAFVSSDLSILVTLPEPSALSAASNFLRSCVLEALQRQLHLAPAEALLELMFRNPLGWCFADIYEQTSDSAQRELFVQACSRLSIGLLMNKVREGSESEQALSLCHAWALELGVWPRVLGGVLHDDRRWFFARRLAPAASHPQKDSIAGDIEEIVRRINPMDWEAWRAPRACLPCIDPAQNPAIFLDLDAGGGTVRQRYRRLWEGYRREAGLISFVLQNAARTDAVKLLEAAYRRAAIDDGDQSGAPLVSRVSVPPGQQLKDRRLALGLSQRELSLKTRVGVRHIEAIEAMNERALTNRVYLKAYLAELTKTLGLDTERLVEAYMQALGQD